MHTSRSRAIHSSSSFWRWLRTDVRSANDSVARRCAAQGDVARTDAVATSWPSSQRCLAARVEARGNSGDVRGAVELAEAGEPIYPVVANAAMRALSLIGDGAGARELLRRLPETAVDRGTYLLAMRAHKCDVDGCLALFRACEPATGEPVDEKLVAAALEALAEATLDDLDHAGAVELDGSDVHPATLGQVASYYYLDYKTTQHAALTVDDVDEKLGGADDEALAPTLCEWTGGTTGLRILSNLADRRVFRAQCSILPEELGVGELPGQEVARRIVSAARFAR